MFNSRVPARFVRGTLAALFALFSLVLAIGGSVAQAILPDVIAARVSTTPERGRLILDLSGMTEFAIVSLREPDRIAVDIRAASVKTIAPQPVSGQGIVAGFTTAVAEEGRVRVELSLAVPAMVQQAYLLDPVGDQPARLVVDLVATSAEDFAARAAADLANAMGSVVPSTIEAPSESVSEAPSSEPLVSEAPAAIEPAPSAEPVQAPVAEPAAGSRPLVVLDPGHGGVDNGASAPSGLHEKGITLAFALQLRDLLVASGKFDVALTRDEDIYMTLNERVDLARQNKADLFISLHADTFQQADIRGASIYTRDERASDILDKVLADGENRADIVAGYVEPDVKQPVVDILVDLMRRQVRQQAFVAAGDIVKAMEPSVTLRRFPVRQADFFVLQAPEIPSMLIELGFMSNAADIQNLESESWRDKVVGAIAEGVEQYFAALEAAQ
ncbi:MAG: N-acetylmuramoyl-L-alanine amidase [Hyphomicrobiales bacterium]|nr:MAG: N-acetylmuramoyl-L-alanine amidase [Hyphomicrobiales bacterium]